MTDTSHSVYKTGGEKLVSMANQIGIFFKSYPEEVGVEGIREHIAKFWNRKMREELFAHIDSQDGQDLEPFVAKAIERLR